MTTEKNAIGFPTESGGFEEIASDAPKASPDGLTAQDVAYGNETVDDALTELNSNISANTFGTYVDISPYTSSSNQYTAPCDGIFRCGVNGTSGTSVGYVNNTPLIIMNGRSDMPDMASSIFVRKGMKLHVDINNGYGTFFPIV